MSEEEVQLNPYEIMGLEEDATPGEIRKAYRLLSKELHPDVNPDGQEEFIELNSAYKTLIDPEARKDYHETGQFKGIQNVERKAMQTLCSYFMQLVNNNGGDIFYVDIIKSIEHELKKDINTAEGNLHAAESLIEHLERVKKRIVTRNDAQPIFTSAVSQRIMGCRGEASAFKTKIEEAKKGLEILKDHGFSTDEAGYLSGGASRLGMGGGWGPGLDEYDDE